MSYQSALDELNKNLQLYLQNKCDPALNHLSKAVYQLTLAIEQDMKDQGKLLKSLKTAVERLERSDRSNRSRS